MKTNFLSMLSEYRQLVDDELAIAAKALSETTSKRYGEHAALAVDAYGSLLSRGGKRIRGALVTNAYKMCGGKDTQMILQAACAVEMIHAYILIIDDIQDRSDVRRGGLTVHKLLEKKSRESGWRGDNAHTGISLALNGALIGAHEAQNMLTKLNAADNLRTKAIQYMNNAMIITAHGQSGDIINEINSKVTEKDIDDVLMRKTAHYTILNPLQIGMILAGANDSELTSVEPYALALGRAFQITDDLLPYTANSSDKDIAGDIKEGKMTLVMLYALEHATLEGTEFLRRSLGNQDLTESDFRRCVDIVEQSGAIDYSIKLARTSVESAIAEKDGFSSHWQAQNVEFLGDLAQFILERKG